MKKIRIDYYNYRLKKGRAQLLLQKVEGTQNYRIPCHYVWSGEHLGQRISGHRMEDDGDLVIIEVRLNAPHLHTSAKDWIPLDRIRELSICRDESLHLSHHIFRFFLDICPAEGESGLRKRVTEMLETVKIDIAKKAYIDELRCFLEGDGRLGHVAGQPNPELVQKEMETLEHFRLRKPLPIPMCQWDADLIERDEYGYEPVDWMALGGDPFIEVRIGDFFGWGQFGEPKPMPPYCPDNTDLDSSL